MCFSWSSLSMDLFNNVWDMMQRSAPKIFCMTQDPAAWFSSVFASLDCTSMSSLPQREKRLEHVKKIGTYIPWIKCIGAWQRQNPFYFCVWLDFLWIFLVCYIILFFLSYALITHQKVFFLHFLDFENFCMDMKILQNFSEIWVILAKM